jgi:hypothetical protein
MKVPAIAAGSSAGAADLQTASRTPEHILAPGKSRSRPILTPAMGTQVVRPRSRAIIAKALLAEARGLAARFEHRDHPLDFPNLLLNARLRRLEFVGLLYCALLKAVCDR